MARVGDYVRWCNPLDADYSYGTLLKIKKSIATVKCSGYYSGIIVEVHMRYIERVTRGGKGFGNSKKYRKRSTP